MAFCRHLPLSRLQKKSYAPHLGRAQLQRGSSVAETLPGGEILLAVWGRRCWLFGAALKEESGESPAEGGLRG